jgi:hypothetical protein
LKDQRTDEAATWLEHELMPNVGIRIGYVFRRISNFNVLVNVNRPFNAFNVPVAVADRGPTGAGDAVATIQAFNLDPAYLPLPVLNTQTNLPGVAQFHNLEFSATKRATGRWSLQGSFAYHLNHAQDATYFGNRLRATAVPANPNDTINTDGGRYDFATWSAKALSTIDVLWGMRVTPTLRLQSGQPFGRIIVAQLNYGAQQILTEPLDSQRQPNVALIDARVEKLFRLGNQKLSAFVDVFNITNANTPVNLTWTSGSSYLLPSVFLAPRIMRLGLKLDW